MALGDYKKRAAAGGNGSSNLGGAAIEVISFNKDDSATSITGKLLFDAIGRKADDEIIVKYNAETAAKIEENLKRGMGSGKGSVLVLENVLNANGPEDNVVNARWITTAISAAKSLDPQTGHANRSVESVMLATPTILFANPNPAKGEPKYIHFGLTATKSWIERKEYDRDWLRAKLGEADPAKVQVSALALAPDTSVSAKSLDEAINTIGEMLDMDGGVALVRVHDANDVVAQQIRKPYNVELPDFLKSLKEGNLFRDVPNQAVADELAAGSWTLEVIQGVDIPYLGDTRMKLVKDVVENPLEDLMNYRITFGEESGGRVVDALIVTMPTKTGAPMFCHEPIRLQGKRSSITFLKTPHFDRDEPARNTNAPAAEQGAGDQGDAPQPGGEEFSADDYSFDTPSSDDIKDAQQSTARQRRTPN